MFTAYSINNWSVPQGYTLKITPQLVLVYIFWQQVLKEFVSVFNLIKLIYLINE